MFKGIRRSEYTNFLHNWKDKNVIKVLTGVRRAGKSTLLEMFQDELINKEKIDGERIHSINFEKRAFRGITNHIQLEDYLFPKLITNERNYVFLDEVQLVESFEKTVDALFVEENVDVYITGSNAYFLSTELATLLSGRYVEKQVLPLSFYEFVTWQRENNPAYIYWTLSMYYEEYIKTSFPFALSLDNFDDIRIYLEGIYSTVLLKDVATRKKITEVANLERVTQFLFSVIGSSISTDNIRKSLNSTGTNIAASTIEKYLSGLEESLLFFPVRKYDIRGKELLKRSEKYYAVDVGLREIALPDAREDLGHILENIVFLELLRRKKHVYIGKVDKYEIDFVTMDGKNELEFYQVALQASDQATLERELRPLERLKNSYPKYLLTLDEIGKETSYEGIRKMNALDWLMG